MTTRSMTMLNEMGDLTITWDEDKDDEMSQIIQKKLDQGIRFFIIKPFSKEQVEVKTLADITGRTISIPDSDIEKMFTDGKVGIVKRLTTGLFDTLGIATTVKEVATNHTVATRQLKGG